MYMYMCSAFTAHLTIRSKKQKAKIYPQKWIVYCSVQIVKRAQTQY